MSTHISKYNITTAIVYKKLIPVPNTSLVNEVWYVVAIEDGEPKAIPLFDVYPEDTLVFGGGFYSFKRRVEITTTDNQLLKKYFETELEATTWETENLPNDDYINFEDDI